MMADVGQVANVSVSPISILASRKGTRYGARPTRSGIHAKATVSSVCRRKSAKPLVSVMSAKPRRSAMRKIKQKKRIGARPRMVGRSLAPRSISSMSRCMEVSQSISLYSQLL